MSTPGEYPDPAQRTGGQANRPHEQPVPVPDGYAQPVSPPPMYGQAAPQRPVDSALGAVLFVIVAGVAAAIVSGFGGLVVGVGVGGLVLGVLSTVFFAGGALLSLALVRALPPSGPLTRYVTPLLIAGAIGSIGLLIVAVGWSALPAASLPGDFAVRLIADSIFSAIAEGVLLTAVLALGAFASRIRGRMLPAALGGSSSPASLARTAAVAGVVVLAASAFVTVVDLLVVSGLSVAPLVVLLRVAVFAAAGYVSLAFIRPLARVRTARDAYTATAVAGAIATGVLLVFDIVVGLLQGSPALYVFASGVFSSVSDGVLFTFVLGFGVVVALLRSSGVPNAAPDVTGPASAVPQHPHPPQQGQPPRPPRG